MIRALRPSRTVAVLCLALLAPVAAAAGDAEAIERREVHVHKIVHDCESDDCEHAGRHRRVIVLGGDGERTGIGGDVVEWIGEDGLHAFAMGHHGKGGFLGVATTELTPELRRHFGAPEDAGVLVARVVADSAAALAGVQVGDILTAVGGDAVRSTGDLFRAVGRLEPGTAVNLELWRDGTLQTLGTTLGERQRPARHAVLMRCDDGEEECPQLAALKGFDCGGGSDCEVRIECREAGCECTVNGQSAECETLPGFVAPGD